MNNRIHVTLTHIYNATFEKTIWNKTAYSPPKKHKNPKNQTQQTTINFLPPPCPLLLPAVRLKRIFLFSLLMETFAQRGN